MIKFSLSFLFLLFQIVFANKATAQLAGTSNKSEQITKNITNIYNKAIGHQSQLYRGAAYEFYDVSSTGSPYFNELPAFSKGIVVYDGTTYTDVPLLYDQFKRMLVTLLYNNFSKLSLLNDYVSEFYLHGHHFVRLWPDEKNPKFEADFYDQIYAGKLQLFIKRVKTREEEGLTGKKLYRVKDVYYIKKNNVYYPVNNNGQLWDTLEDKKKELKRYIKDKGIDLSNNRERTLLMLVTYYDQISN